MSPEAEKQPYSYRIERTKSYLLITSSGVFKSQTDVLDYADKLFREFDKWGLKSILMDERKMKHIVSNIDIYEIGKYVAERLAGDYRIAIVYDKEFFSKGGFFETVASNRSLCVRIFLDFNEAEKWLTEGD